MKLQKLIAGFMLIGLFAACNNDTFVEEPEVIFPEGGDSFMAVNIVTPKTSTRGFEDGEKAESAVKNAVFFFFKSDGSSAFPAITPNLTFTDSGTSSDNVTSISNVVIVFDSKEGKAIPNSMVAILNPTADIASLISPSLSDLSAKIPTDYLNGVSGDGSAFIMSNSTYMGDNKAIINATPIKANNIFTKQEDATKAPVNVYVERLAAKVKVDAAKINAPIEVGTISLDGQSVKVKLSNAKWDIVTTNPSSFLLKQIDPAWTFDPTFVWNDPTNFRSYWANTVRPAQYVNKSFTNIQSVSHPYTYCLENTDNANTTKLLVSGILTYENGTVLDLMEWGGLKFTPDGMKTQIANMVSYYTRTGSGVAGDQYVYTLINKNNITFTSTGASKQYHVVANITDGTYYTLSGNVGTPVDKSVINTALVNLGNIKYWNGGRNYYFTDINHSNNQPGIVRNHVYKLTVNSVTGLGTPVPNADEIIVPIKPENDESYIAATIDILAWKIVSQNVDLN